MTILNRLIYLTPFLLGAFLPISPAASSYKSFVLLNLTSLLLLLSLADVMVNIIRPLKPLTGKLKRVREKRYLFYPFFICLAAILLYSLYIIKAEGSDILLYLSLGLIPLKTYMMSPDFSFRTGIAIRILFFSGVGFFSFFSILPDPSFLMFNLVFGVPFSIGTACYLTALWVIIELKELEKQSAAKMDKRIKRSLEKKRIKDKDVLLPSQEIRKTYAILMVIGPILIALLVFLKQIPYIYILGMLCIPYSSYLFNQLALQEETSALPESFLRQSTGIYLLFLAIMALCGQAG